MKKYLLAMACALCLITLARADLTGWRLGIDPGHGGSDPGAVGPTGLQEKEVNLDAALGLRQFLLRSNAEVFMTRTTDVYLSLSARANYLNANDVDRSLCVHHNASSSSSANWHLTYVAVGYAWATAGNLAYDVSHRVTDFNGLPFGWSNCGREGVYEENFYMLVYTTMPTVLPEISFISNPAEEQRLYRDHYCYGNGRAMYFGIMDHLNGWPEMAGENAFGQAVGGAAKVAPSEGESDLQACVTPNPFNPSTTLRFDLLRSGWVKLEVFDVSGRSFGSDQARILREGWLEAGAHEVTFEGADLPSGVYVYRLRAGKEEVSGKMMLLK